MENVNKVINDFCTKGFAVIPHFLEDNETELLKNECKTLIDKMDSREEHAVFSTGDDQKANHYFMTSADKIRYFYEKNAFNASGDLVVDKYLSLNKIGHALHWLSPAFKSVTFSPKVKQLVKNVGFVDPVVVQSMYIFKNPGIGGEVIPHQDATYLHSTPEPKCIGLWFALEDATEENGCLEFIPGSHTDGLHTQWIRTNDENSSMKLTKEMSEFGKKIDEKAFIKVPVSKGSAVLIDGLVVHKSDLNHTSSGRPIYTFHIFDQNNRVWDPLNWLQPSPQLPFPSLYDN
ncbi:unnamed protein product [Medioppia subpectinata]|uniref:Phytanoyl-CoA dioxygenase n=1 Tax=Medioppia subpectinata TaxID=1979941 RepID=A0A7R9PY86_9ACAR|nr:unnamed protein product [Medioppia subpectinata]CAG2105136.1 unnamed protein product [Medioppia subpectinata]